MAKVIKEQSVFGSKRGINLSNIKVSEVPIGMTFVAYARSLQKHVIPDVEEMPPDSDTEES